MNCREIEKDLIPYADGDLNDVRAEMIKSHLASCADCQAALQPIQQTLDMAKTYRVPVRSDQAASRMLVRIRSGIEQHRKRYSFRLVPAVFATAALLLLMVIGLRDMETGFDEPIESDYLSVSNRIAVVAQDPELFDEVMTELMDLDVGVVSFNGADPSPPGKASERTVGAQDEPDPWIDYRDEYLRGVQIESLLYDLDDEEIEQVLKKIEERLTV